MGTPKKATTIWYAICYVITNRESDHPSGQAFEIMNLLILRRTPYSSTRFYLSIFQRVHKRIGCWIKLHIPIVPHLLLIPNNKPWNNTIFAITPPPFPAWISAGPYVRQPIGLINCFCGTTGGKSKEIIFCALNRRSNRKLPEKRDSKTGASFLGLFGVSCSSSLFCDLLLCMPCRTSRSTEKGGARIRLLSWLNLKFEDGLTPAKEWADDSERRYKGRDFKKTWARPCTLLLVDGRQRLS